MQLVSGKEAVQRVRNLISEKHQVHAYGVELTARAIHTLNPTGEVDFGGSEYAPAQAAPLPTHQKHSQDRYQWWTLMHGAYQVQFNESLELSEDEIGLLEPHERLLRAGAEHPVQFLRGRMSSLTTLLTVGCARLQIKQNARIAILRVFRLAASAPAKAKPVKAPKKKR